MTLDFFFSSRIRHTICLSDWSSDVCSADLDREIQLVVQVPAALAAPAIIRGRDLNDKLNLAIIGAGGRGADNLRGVQSENVEVGSASWREKVRIFACDERQHTVYRTVRVST